MIIDTSAIVAAIGNEADSRLYREAFASATNLLISAATLLETRIVLFARLGPAALVELERFLLVGQVEVVPFDRIMSDSAFDAFRRYGKGQGHPAQLNIIDCAAYALARMRDMPLLFKGGDFHKTDIAAVIPSPSG